MEWVALDSRMLAAASYSQDWQQLYLRFRSGEVYCYRGVPAERYRELLAAESKGRYFREHIRNCYPYQRIRAAVLAAS
jgi:hypothetical protein